MRYAIYVSTSLFASSSSKTVASKYLQLIVQGNRFLLCRALHCFMTMGNALPNVALLYILPNKHASKGFVKSIKRFYSLQLVHCHPQDRTRAQSHSNHRQQPEQREPIRLYNHPQLSSSKLSSLSLRSPSNQQHTRHPSITKDPAQTRLTQKRSVPQPSPKLTPPAPPPCVASSSRPTPAALTPATTHSSTPAPPTSAPSPPPATPSNPSSRPSSPTSSAHCAKPVSAARRRRSGRTLGG